jgi:hypothetical protein
MEIVTLNHDNIGSEHICCTISDGKCALVGRAELMTLRSRQRKYQGTFPVEGDHACARVSSKIQTFCDTVGAESPA